MLIHALIHAFTGAAECGDCRNDSNREEGSTTVEYAIGAVAAAGFAGLLLVVLKSGAMRSALQGIIEQALTL